jgi:hypothetical protein
MPRPKAKTQASGEANVRRPRPVPAYVEAALVLGWVLVPLVQYVCADQRMRLITTGAAPFEWLAMVDLTVAYVLLVAATVVYAVVRAMRRSGVSSDQ